jgi:hypothetical protein
VRTEAQYGCRSPAFETITFTAESGEDAVIIRRTMTRTGD